MSRRTVRLRCRKRTEPHCLREAPRFHRSQTTGRVKADHTSKVSTQAAGLRPNEDTHICECRFGMARLASRESCFPTNPTLPLLVIQSATERRASVAISVKRETARLDEKTCENVRENVTSAGDDLA